ncbi:MAG: ATP synthase F1 subunit delta, partial [Elusimicrobiaceae bacterium]|nr:ATP synthase F1 subunit delta [Elusimicrobiaceae bacterium]
PTINSKVKESLIEKSLPENIARELLKVLIKEKRFNLADEILKELNILLDERRGIKRAQVTSAVALDDKTKTQIQTALENYFKTKLTLGFKEDKSLITGLKIKVGDFYIEDSSRSRLRELENILTE